MSANKIAKNKIAIAIFSSPFNVNFFGENKKVRTTEAIRTEKRKLQLSLHNSQQNKESFSVYTERNLRFY